MGLHRLFHSLLEPGLNRLSDDESRHALASLRMKPGCEVVLFDGAGRQARGTVESIDRRSVLVRVERIEQRPFDSRHRLTLAVAMAKTHRQGYMIEKCTELGVAAVWPVVAERSVARPGEAAVEKWSRRAVEAAKQSGRAWVPDIAAPMTLANAMSRNVEFAASAVADMTDDAVSLLGFLQGVPAGESILVFIGPEGGWTDAERTAARDTGATLVRFAPAVLRAETAAVAVCAAEALLSAIA